ncbi:HAD family hydrolase [Mycoplasma sp. CSL7475-4]|uniref:HAD family hydrolase n=1 Tax=Mycoplasma sp. CSL7475-4 TaxID=2973942 RepID=UPI00216B281C|nr:HAD family hydrolase [Mycoplasma sp. CSL7475-4]MCS4536727.1 HAD family hydrolase [Mycoplasma sp. CSL7475-4]
MGKIFKRVAFSEIKNTFYDFAKEEINIETKQSILEYTKEGMLFVQTTTSPLFNFDNNISQKLISLASETNSRYIIANNGAEIFDAKDKKYLKFTTIDKSIIEKILMLVAKNDCAIDFNFLVDFDLTDSNEIVFNNTNLNRNNSEVLSISISAKPDVLSQIHNKLLKNNLKIEMVFNNDSIDITAKNVSLQNSIDYLINKVLNADINDSMAIAYSEKDLATFNKIGFLYAVDDAPKSVKDSVKLFTSATNQNGVGEAFMDYFYRTRMKFEIAEKIRIQKLKKAKEEAKINRQKENRAKISND